MSTDRASKIVRESKSSSRAKHTNHANPMMVARCEACTDAQKVNRLEMWRDSTAMFLGRMAHAYLTPVTGWQAHQVTADLSFN
jgi:hypothetical protein